MIICLRFFCLAVFLVLASAISFPILCCIPFSTNKVHILGRLFSRPIFKILGIKIEMEGRELFGRHHPCLYIANHQTNLDLFIIASIMPPHSVSLGKTAIARIPIFGLIYYFAGNILIDRVSKRNALSAMKKVADQIIKKNVSVFLFPEGTRSRGKGLLPFKNGAFNIAHRIERPLVPVVVSSYAQKKFALNRWRAGTIYIKVLDAIHTEGKNRDDIALLRESSFKLFQQTLKFLDQ